MYRGQFCHFKIDTSAEGKTCLKFKGFSQDKIVMEYDLCNPVKLMRQRELREGWIRELATLDAEEEDEQREMDL